MSSIDYDRLLYQVKETINEEDQNKYDFDNIIRTATLVWDNTAIQVKSSDFTMIFDRISYELIEYTGYDIK